MLQNWFKIYVYNSKKNKAYFFLTILCLAIGIAAVLLSTLYLKEEYSFDQWNENKETIHFVENKGEKMAMTGHPFALGIKLKEEYSFVEDYLSYGYYQASTVEYKDKPVAVDKILATTQNFFDFFPYEMVYGAKQQIFKAPSEIVLEEQKAVALFGKGKNPVGEQVKIDNKIFTIVGVYRLENKRSSFMPEAVVNSYQFLTEEQASAWDQLSGSLLVKTSQPEETAKAIDALYMKYYFEPWAKKSNITLEALLEQLDGMLTSHAYLHALPLMHFQKDGPITGYIPEPMANVKLLYIIVGLSWLILLLSLFNYVNLSLSQVLFRAKEVGVRKVLGGVSTSVLKQSLFETSITICLAFVLSVLLLYMMLPFTNLFLQTNMMVQVQDFALLFVAVYVLIILFAGLIPAIYISKYRVLKVLKGDFHRSRSGSFIKNTFLIIQFASACWFISGTYIVYQQAKYMTTKDLGFKVDQIISVPFLIEEDSEGKAQKYLTFKAEALKIKGIEELAVASLEYGEQHGGSSISVFPYKDQNVMTMRVPVEGNYFEMMNMQLKAGRFLDQKLATDSIENVMINESLLATLGETNIEAIHLPDYKIVGLLQDFHTGGLESPVQPMMFSLLSNDSNFYSVNIKVDVNQLETAIPALEQLWQKFNVDAKLPFEYEFVNQQFAQTFNKIQQQKQVLLYLGAIVVFIALFGLFAVSSFNIGTKLREIVIRRVLGANSNALIRKLSYQYVIYCIIGFGLSVLPSYYLLNLWLKDYAYRIEIGYEVYLVCFVLIVLLTLIIVVSRAYKATRVNVLKYIKYE